jgi:hypothetical protein
MGEEPSGRTSAKGVFQTTALLVDFGGSVGREKKDERRRTEHRKEEIPEPGKFNKRGGSAARRDPKSQIPTFGGTNTGGRVV